MIHLYHSWAYPQRSRICYRLSRSFMFTASCSVPNSQEIESAQMSLADEWIMKVRCINTIGFFSAVKKMEFEVNEWSWEKLY